MLACALLRLVQRFARVCVRGMGHEAASAMIALHPLESKSALLCVQFPTHIHTHLGSQPIHRARADFCAMASGEVVGTAKIAPDVTDRKRAEEALREADRRKDEFIATLSHEAPQPARAVPQLSTGYAAFGR